MSFSSGLQSQVAFISKLHPAKTGPCFNSNTVFLIPVLKTRQTKLSTESLSRRKWSVSFTNLPVCLSSSASLLTCFLWWTHHTLNTFRFQERTPMKSASLCSCVMRVLGGALRGCWHNLKPWPGGRICCLYQVRPPKRSLPLTLPGVSRHHLSKCSHQDNITSLVPVCPCWSPCKTLEREKTNTRSAAGRF